MSDTTNYLLVDMGYLLFYRYYATKLWWKRAHPKDSDAKGAFTEEEMASDPHFEEVYRKRVRDCIEWMMHTYHIEPTRVYFCADCKRSEIWRMDTLPSYKACRDGKCPSGVGVASRYLRDEVEKLAAEWGAHYLRVPTAEADDIVYVVRKQCREANPEARFVILASDADYHQICMTDTQLIRLDKRDAMRSSTRNLDGVTAEEAPALDLLVKVISGDKSDNIPAIAPKCGPKTALRLARDPAAIEALFAKQPEARAVYEKNRGLIDMSRIPQSLQAEIAEAWRLT